MSHGPRAPPELEAEPHSPRRAPSSELLPLLGAGERQRGRGGAAGGAAVQLLARHTAKAGAASGWEGWSTSPGAGRVASECQGSLDVFKRKEVYLRMIHPLR